MGLFSKRKIQGDELLHYLDYLGEEWKLKAFQEQEAARYTEALDCYSSHNSKDDSSIEHLLDAANRLALSAAELIRRKDAITSVPDKATSLFFAWHAAYIDYLAWAVAQAEALEARLEKRDVDSVALKELQTKSEHSRSAAEVEEGKLLKLLNTTDVDLKQLFDRVEQFISQDNWRPRSLNQRSSN